MKFHEIQNYSLGLNQKYSKNLVDNGDAIRRCMGWVGENMLAVILAICVIL